MIAKTAYNVIKGGRNKNESNYDREDRRHLGRTPIVLGAVALTGVTLVASIFGVQRAMDRNQFVTKETVVQGGEAEIVSFDADYEAHCWTATTIQVNGAGMKDEAKALGASVGWQEYTVDTQLKNNTCIGGTALAIAVNTQTGHVKVDVPDKDSLYTQTEIVLGTIKPHQDQTVGYAFAENITTFLESVPVLEDFGVSKDLSAAGDEQMSAKLNTALIVASKLAYDQCNAASWKLAKKPVEHGLTRMVSLGLHAAKAMNLNVDPTNVSVTVEGVPISQVESVGSKTNIDAAYEKLKKFDDGSDTFTIQQAPKDECKVSSDVTQLPSQTEPVVLALANGASNE